MAEKLLVLASMVISQGKGLIKYYNDAGEITTVRAKEAQVVDELPEATPEAEVGFENPDFSDEDPVVEPADEEDEAAIGFNPEELEDSQFDQQQDEAAEIAEVYDAKAQYVAEGDNPDSQQAEESLPATPVVNSRGKAKTRTETVKKVPTKVVKPAVKKVAAAPAKAAAKTVKAAPPATKKAALNGHVPGNTVRTIAGREHDISGYVKTKNASGVVSFDNGDATAEKLREKTLDQVYDIVAKALKEDVKALRAKYKHLNQGMQRMTLGNRMRKVVRAKEASASA